MELSNRLKYGDLNEKYRQDVLASFNRFERDVMISAVNVICGNIEIECASAINSLTSLYVPTDYTYVENTWGNSFYKIYHTYMKYEDAKAQCESDGTLLAIPRSQDENDFILDLIIRERIRLGQTGRLSGVWIGINDIKYEGLFMGVDGSEISWTNWNYGEPNGVNQMADDEDGVEMDGYNGLWNTWRTQWSGPFICSINVEGKISSELNDSLTGETNYACNFGCDRDQICLQSYLEGLQYIGGDTSEYHNWFRVETH